MPGRIFIFYSVPHLRRCKAEWIILIHHAEESKRNKIEPLKAYQKQNRFGHCDLDNCSSKTTANPFSWRFDQANGRASHPFHYFAKWNGNVENLLHFFGNDRLVIAGLCFTCINRTSAGVIESLLPGYVQFGQLGEQLSTEAQRMVDAFVDAGVKVRKSNSLRRHFGENFAGIFPLMVCPSLPGE